MPGTFIFNLHIFCSKIVKIVKFHMFTWSHANTFIFNLHIFWIQNSFLSHQACSSSPPKYFLPSISCHFLHTPSMYCILKVLKVRDLHFHFLEMTASILIFASLTPLLPQLSNFLFRPFFKDFHNCTMNKISCSFKDTFQGFHKIKLGTRTTNQEVYKIAVL